MRTRLVVTLAILAVAGCSDDGDKAASMPERAPAWETSVSGIGPTRQASVVGDTVIVKGEELVVALDRSDGAERWKQPISTETEVRVTPRSVVAYDDRHFAVYDVRTGRRGFRHDSPVPGRATVSTNAVFVHSCAARTRACSVIAFELPGGAVRWRYGYTRDAADNPLIEIPGDDSIRLSEPGRYVEPLVARPADVVQISREGPARVVPLSVLNAATGKLISSGRIPSIWTRILNDRTGLYWADSKACDVQLTGYAVATGKPTWKRSAGRWGEPHRGMPDCDYIAWTPALHGTTAAVTTPDQRPSLIELETGKVRWTGDAGTHVMDLTATTVLARAGEGNGALVGLDTADGHQRWQIDLPDRSRPVWVDRSAIVGSRLTFSLADTSGTDRREVLRVHNAETGELQWAAKGSNWTLGVGQDWIVTADEGAEDDETPKTIRLFAG